MNWLNLNIGDGLTEKELGDKQAEIKEWMELNIDGDWTCDWEFGGDQGYGTAEFYLNITFTNDEDKVKFILKWG